MEGRHLPNGSAEWRRPRFRNFPRGAWRPEEHGPFLGPNPSIKNHRGSEARRSYSAAQLEYYLTYKPLALRKAPQSSWVRAGSPRAGPLGTGPCTRRPLNPRNMHSGSPPFFAELVRGTPLDMQTLGGSHQWHSPGAVTARLPVARCASTETVLGSGPSTPGVLLPLLPGQVRVRVWITARR